EGLWCGVWGGRVEGGVGVARRDRQQGDGLAEVFGPLSKHRLKLIKPLLVCIVAPELGRPFELRDAWVESTVLMMRRAKVTQSDMRLTAQPLQNGLSDARFANAGFARDQHHAALAPLRLIPAAQEQ